VTTEGLGTDPNNAPVAQDQSVGTGVNQSLALLLAFTDPDGPGPYTFTIVTPPSHGALSGSDANRTYTPDQDFSGSDSFTWRVNDGQADSNIATVSINIAQSGSLLSDDFNRTDDSEIGQNWVEVEQVGAAAVIAANQLFFADTSDVTNRPLVRRSFAPVSTGSLQWDFDFDWTRTGDEGTYRFLMQLGDSATMNDGSQDAGAGVNLVWTTINGTHQSLGRRNAGVDTALAVINGPTHISVVADLDTHTYSVAVNGSVVGAGIPFDANGPLNTVRFLTDNLNEANFSGRTIDNVNISASVAPPPNTPPLAQGQSVGTAVNTILPVTLTATDPDECQLAFSTVTGPANGTLSSLFDQACVPGSPSSDSAALTYTPNTGFTGPDSFSFRANDSFADSNVATVTVNVGGGGAATLLEEDFNRADDSAVGNGWVELEQTGATVAIANQQLIFADTSDISLRPLVRRSFAPASTGSLQWDFDFDWTRTGNESTYRFLMQLGDSVTMNDGSQNAGAGINLVWTTINGTHQSLGRRKAGVDTALAVVSGPAHISVVADLDAQTYLVAVDGSVVGAGIPFDANGPLDSVRFLTDSLNEANLSGRTIDNVIITTSVAPAANTPPLAQSQSVGTAVDTILPVTLTATDPEECQLAFSTVAGPTNGTLSSLSDQDCVPGSPSSDSAAVTYTPNNGFTGPDSFSFRANDTLADSNIATVTVNVGGGGANVLLEEDFNRADDSAVGNGWVELEQAGAAVAIASQKLIFADTSNIALRPQVRKSFTEVTAGTVQWDFDFDWTRTGVDSGFQLWMQLGDGAQMVPTDRFSGAGVDLQWSLFGGVDQNLVARQDVTMGGPTGLLAAPLSGPKHLTVTASLDTRTYSVAVDGGEVATGLSFDNLASVSKLDTVRFFTHFLDEANFSGRTFDNVIISGE
jgi:hypothetical protein